MPFIGAVPAQKYISLAKQDFTTIAGTGYTLDQSVTNEVDIALFINHVRQEPTTAYTASGTTLTLTSATTTSDDMYCVFLGKATETINPPNSSVGTDQLEASAVTTAKIADSSVTSAKLSGVTQGITIADQWRLTSDFLGDGTLTAWEQIDGTGQGTLGSSMSVSSGIFTFPATGIYLVMINWSGRVTSSADTEAAVTIQATTDNSTYNEIVRAGDGGLSNGEFLGNSGSTLLDVTDTSNVKVKVVSNSFNTSGDDTRAFGDTNINKTTMMFLRLGDT